MKFRFVTKLIKASEPFIVKVASGSNIKKLDSTLAIENNKWYIVRFVGDKTVYKDNAVYEIEIPNGTEIWIQQNKRTVIWVRTSNKAMFNTLLGNGNSL